MCSKTTKQFKERLQQQKRGSEEKIKSNNSTNVVIINMDNKIINVESKRGISRWDIIDQVKDLFSLGNVREGELVALSKFCDSMFDLICNNIIQKDNIIEYNMCVC